MPVMTFVASAFAGLASFDGRFWRTVLPLIARPGFLTRELIEGRRVRYVPPMRLYLFVSFVFFLTVQLTGQEIVVNTSSSSGRSMVMINTEGSVETEQFDADGSPIPSDEDGGTEKATVPDGEAAATQAGNGNDNDNDNDDEGVPEAGEDAARADGEAVEDDEGLGALLTSAILRLAEDPERGTDVLLRRLPIMVFLMVPLAALWLRLLFRRHQSYYVPNLVASLHLHSAALLLLNITMLTEYLPGPDVLGGLILLWIPIYTLLTLKRVYRTGWWGSLWRMGAFNVVHTIFLTLGLLVSVVITGLSL